MNISLPNPLKKYVDEKVSSGIYGSASEFIREAVREKLVREQESEAEMSRFSEKLLEGVRSNKSVLFTDDYFGRKKAALLRKVSRKNHRP